MSRFSKRLILLTWLAADSFAVMEPLTYTAINGDVITCQPLLRQNADGQYQLYFVTDLGSEPIATDVIVGDRCGKITLASIIHDWLYRMRLVLRNGELVSIDEAYADALLREMCLDPACSESAFEADATYAGVRAGGGWVWDSRTALDLSTVTEDNMTEDFVKL